MRTNTRRALTLATAVLAGAGALAAGSGSASAAELTASSSTTAVRGLTASQVADLTAVTIYQPGRPPIWCCGNLGPLKDFFTEPDFTEVDVPDMGDITQDFTRG